MDGDAPQGELYYWNGARAVQEALQSAGIQALSESSCSRVSLQEALEQGGFIYIPPLDTLSQTGSSSTIVVNPVEAVQ